MPLFYFDLYDGLSGLDQVGKDCANREAAQREASGRAEKLLIDDADWFRTGQDWQIGVMDPQGALVFSLDFRSSIDGTTTIRSQRRIADPVSDNIQTPFLMASACEQAC